jgi:hypothetical protein
MLLLLCSGSIFGVADDSSSCGYHPAPIAPADPTENIVTTVGSDCANPINDSAPNVVQCFRVIASPVRINWWGSAEVSLDNYHRWPSSLPTVADTRVVRRPQHRSSQGNADEVVSCWTSMKGGRGEPFDANQGNRGNRAKVISKMNS